MSKVTSVMVRKLSFIGWKVLVYSKPLVFSSLIGEGLDASEKVGQIYLYTSKCQEVQEH